MVLTLWSPFKFRNDKDALKGIKHWGDKRQLWYRSQNNKLSNHNVYSTQKILGVKSVKVKKLHGYGMLLLAVQHKLFHLNESDIVDLIVALRIWTLKKVRDELHHRVLDFRLGYNDEMPRRKWTDVDKRISQLMVELIDKQMRERKIFRNLKRLVGAREVKMDYKMMTHQYYGDEGSIPMRFVDLACVFWGSSSVCGKCVGFEKGYYLADGIYPQWATFVKSFTDANDAKHAYFKKRQESERKDVERAFGVLQGRWGIIQQPARQYHVNTIRDITDILDIFIMHNYDSRRSKMAVLTGKENVTLIRSRKYAGVWS
ncbi:ribonuclease H-like domain-containing protein [Tanacetum coccineum]